MVKHTKGFKGLSKKVLSAILAASMIMTSSSFVLAAPEMDPVVNEATTGQTVLDEKVTIEQSEALEYNGEAQKPELTVTDVTNSEVLSADTDYEVTGWESNVNAGTYTVKVEFKGDYVQNAPRTAEYTIQQKSIAGATVDYDTIRNVFLYNQQPQLPEIDSVTVKLNTSAGEKEVTLEEGVDYEVDAEAAINASTVAHTADLVGKGNYSGRLADAVSYTIQKAELNTDQVTATVGPVLYNSDASKVAENVKGALSVVENITGETLENNDLTCLYKDDKGEWSESALPACELGTQTVRVVPGNDCDNYEGGYVDVEFTVVGDYTLQTMIDKATAVGDFTKTNGVFAFEYDGSDHFVESLTGSDLPAVNTEYKIVTTKAEWVDAGDYTVEIQGLGKYAGQTATIPVKITPFKLLKNATDLDDAKNVSITASRGTHSNGTVGDVYVTATAEVDREEVALENGKDYTYKVVEGSNGKFDVVVTGIGNFTTVYDETTEYKLKASEITTSEKLNLADPSIIAEVTKTFPSGGASITVEPEDIKVVETLNGSELRTLDPTTDYYVKSAKVNSDKKSATVVIEYRVGSTWYTGEKTIVFDLVGISVSDIFKLDPIDDMSIEDGKKTEAQSISGVVKYMNGAKYTGNVTTTVYNADGDKLVGTDKLDKAGVYTVKVELDDKKYSGELETTFNVIGEDLKKAGAEIADIEDVVYTGEEQKPAVVVTLDKETLKEGEDYTVAYSDNVNGGEATVTVTGINDYSGTITKNFNITKADQGIYMTVEAQERDLGNGSRYINSKDCTLKLATNVADPNTKYTFSSSDTSVATVSADGVIRYRQVGECVVTVSAAETENCKAATLDIKVKVGKVGAPTFTPSVTSSTAKKSFRVTTSTVRGADGFEVQYSIKSNFWAPRTKDFKIANKVTRQTCTTAQSNKTYYIRTRAYQVIDGEKVYSAWSPVKTVKTK